MRFVSWNVNGLRACMQKGFLEYFNSVNADFFCLQETKLQEGQIFLDLPGYEQYWCYAEKKGYSGTAIFTKHTPLSVFYGMGIPELDTEGRLITLEYPEFYLVTCYTPNAQRGLARIGYRLKWEEAFRAYLSALDTKKPVILCGDLNVAHKEIDLKNPNSNRGNAGFSDEERDAFTKLLECGFTDSFRNLHPDTIGAYTWWSYMFNARQNNAGWRIDYFVVSERIKEQIFSTPIYSEILGSDHCPVGLDLDISCNGSIWSSFENTETPAKAEEKCEKKSSGVKAAAALLCVAVLLLRMYFSPWNSTPVLPTDDTSIAIDDTTPPVVPDPLQKRFTCHVYREPLEYVTSFSPISSSVNPGGLTNGTEYIPIAGLDEAAGVVWANRTYFVEDINFWIRVDAADGIDPRQHYLDVDSVVPQVQEPHKFVERPYISQTAFYDETGSLAGWIVYGCISKDAYLTVKLYNNKGYLLEEEVVPVSPELTEASAADMSTEDLVDYALHHRYLKQAMQYTVVVSSTETFYSFMRSYPALTELTFRQDAIEKIQAHVMAYPSCEEYAAVMEEAIHSIQERFTPYQDACIPSVMETSALISRLSQQAHLSDCIDELLAEPGDYTAVYRILRQLQPAVLELEKREDATAALLAHYGESPIINFLFVQPVFLSQLSIGQANEFLTKLHEGNGIETVSTNNLVMVITSVFHVSASLKISYPYNYAQLRLAFTPLQELENREDAHTVLLSYLIDSTGIVSDTQKAIATMLLYQEPFYIRLDELQLETLKRGGPILYGGIIVSVPAYSPATP